VEALAAALGPVFEPPFAFFGHSMGAIVAFELARQLRREGREGPVRLFVSAARAPHIPDPDPSIHQIPDAQFLEELKRLEGVPREVSDHPELLGLLMPTLRADLALWETYSYYSEAPLPCAISAYGGNEDQKVPLEHLAGWEMHAARGFKLRLFPGKHFFLHNARQQLMDTICEELPAAPPGGLD
jgi:medium-chain acyl-[acyl-carrier-protein] hydrolase